MMANLLTLLPSPTEIFSRLFTPRGTFEFPTVPKRVALWKKLISFPVSVWILSSEVTQTSHFWGRKGTNPVMPRTYTTSDFISN